MTTRKCADCGALHPKTLSWIDALHRSFYFCNLQCKKHFFDVTYPSMIEKERENAEESLGILPQVRTLIAHKNKDGSVTFVRGDGELPSGSAEGAD
jgi:hypothetical protein